MEFPFTTAFVAAVLIIMQVVFMMVTGIHRGKASIGVGFGDDKDLERKIRRHGNLAENAAIFLVVLGLVEGLSGGGLAASIFGFVFLAARISHGIAFSSLAGSHGQENGGRVFVMCRLAGAMGTALSGIGMGLYLLWMLLT